MSILQRIRDRQGRERQLRALVADLILENAALKRNIERVAAGPLDLPLPHEADIRMIRYANDARWRVIFGYDDGVYEAHHQSLSSAARAAHERARAHRHEGV